MIKLILPSILLLSFIGLSTKPDGDPTKKQKPITCDSILDTNVEVNHQKMIVYYYPYWFPRDYFSYQSSFFNENRGHIVAAYNNNVLMYCQPDTTSLVLDTFSFFDYIGFQPLNPIITHQEIEWLRVNNHGRIGYVKREDIADPSRTYYGRENNQVWIGEIWKSYDEENNHKYPYAGMKLINTETGEMGDTAIIGPIISSFHFNAFFCELGSIYQYSSAADRCPGWSYDGFFTINDNNEIVKLGETHGEGESGYYIHSMIYLPVRVGENHIVHVREGNRQYYKAEYTDPTTPDTMPYPKDIGVPIDKLFIKYSEAGGYMEMGKPDTIYRYINYAGDSIEVYLQETEYFEYNNGKVTPIQYPKK